MKWKGKMMGIVLMSALGTTFGDTLFWQIDPNATVHNADGTTSSVYTFLTGQPYDPTGENSGGMHYILGARVNVVTDPSAASQTSWNAGVNRYMETENGRIIQNAANSPVNIGHPSVGLTASGVSTDDNGIAADRQLYYQLSIVLGTHNQWNDDEHYIFREIAWSALYQGGLLDENNNYSFDSMDEETARQLLTEWLPQDYYTYRPVPVYNYGDAPEPDSAILFLLGLGLVGLRRKTI